MADPAKKPKKSDTDVTQAGLKAHGLGTTHAALLEPRLPAGILTDLAANLDLMGIVVPGAKQTRASAKAATKTQAQALASGYQRVTAIRTALKLTQAPADVRKHYGVGTQVNPEVVKSVQTSIKVIVDRAEKYPDEARLHGILKSDIDDLKADSQIITAADTDQEKQRAAAPQSTKARNKALNAVVNATNHIAAAGIIAFAKDESLRKEFEALVGAGLPNPKPPKKSAPT